MANYDYDEWYHAVLAFVVVIPLLYLGNGIAKVYNFFKKIFKAVLEH